MKKILILAGLAAVAATSPALAKPGHHERGEHSERGDRGDRHEHGNRDRGERHEHRTGWGTYGAWGNNCPPGLAKKHNGCMAPGQARKHYRVGQRYANNNYGRTWSYNQIPYDMRQRYNLSNNDRYYYRDGYIYQVNPRTSVIEQVLSALIR